MTTQPAPKRAFQDADGRTDTLWYYPDELVIVGGADHIKNINERGPKDTTAPNEGETADPLYNPLRLEEAIDPTLVPSIDLHGVISTITIVWRDPGASVETGRSRVRASRDVNRRRREKLGMLDARSDREVAPEALKAGLPLIRIPCVGRKSRDSLEILQRMIAENLARKGDSFETLVWLAKAMLALTSDGNDIALVAKACSVVPETLKTWLRFDELATPELKSMVAQGRIKPAAAAILAKVEDPEEQKKKLVEFITAPDIGGQVRRAAKITRKGDDTGNPFVGQRQLKKFSEYVGEEGDKTAFFDGVRAMLKLLTTGKSGDPRLTQLFNKFKG